LPGCWAGGSWRCRDQYSELPQHRAAHQLVTDGFFLGVVGVGLITIAFLERPPACWYDGKAYSPGALATMAEDVQMTCTILYGEPSWARDKSGEGMAPGP
jgi:hypothetical protein